MIAAGQPTDGSNNGIMGLRLIRQPYVLVLLLLSFRPAAAGAAELDQALLEVLQHASPNQMIPVQIVMREQGLPVSARMAIDGLPIPRRRAEVLGVPVEV